MAKVFNTMFNVGKAKYVINYHDGVQTHPDNSPFFGIRLFKNKKAFEACIKDLKKQGYTEQ